ncbi:MAG TPA: hypothetical protein H9774_11970 [Candidatus Desulfovibrio gallistercoris]|nr:hypothetical protein [Candidatus Desulfovibrio gallistercoris]
MPVINIGIDIRQLRTGAAQATATLNGVTASADQATSSANRLSGAIAGAAKQVLALVGAYKALEGMKGFVQRGIEFNSSMEQSKIAIASMITSMANLEDGQGKVLQGAEKYAAAQGIAADMMKEIQRLGLETTATTESLVEGVQSVMAASLNAGLKLNQIPQFAVAAAQAMQTMKIPLEQMRTEIEALLSGNINKAQDLLAPRLGIDKEQLDSWKQQGILYDELMKKLYAYQQAGKDVAQTWKGLTSNLSEALDVIAGQSAAGMSESLKNTVRELQDLFLTSKDGATGISKDFENIAAVIERAQTALGEGILSAVTTFADAVRGVNESIGNMGGAEAAIGQIKTTVATVAAALGSLVLVRRANAAAARESAAANTQDAATQTRLSSAVVQLTEAERQAAVRLQEATSLKFKRAKAALDAAQADLEEAKTSQQAAQAIYDQAKADKDAIRQKTLRRTEELKAAQAAKEAASIELERAEAAVLRAQNERQLYNAEQNRIKAINDLAAAQTRVETAEKRVNAINANSANISRQLNAAETARVQALNRLSSANQTVAASQAAVNAAQSNFGDVASKTRNIGVLAAGVTRLGSAFKALWAGLGGGVGIAIMALVSGVTYLANRQDDAAKAAEIHANALKGYEDATKGAVDGTGKLVGKLDDLQRTQVELNKKKFMDAYKLQIKAIGQAVQDIASESEFTVNQMMKIWSGDFTYTPKEFLSTFQAMYEALKDGSMNAEDFRENLVNLRDSLIESGYGADNLTKTIERLIDGESGLANQLATTQSSIDRANEALSQSKNTAHEAAAANKDYADALKLIDDAQGKEITNLQTAVEWALKNTTQTETMTAATKENSRVKAEAALKELELAEAANILAVAMANAELAIASNAEETQQASKKLQTALAEMTKIQTLKSGVQDVLAGRIVKKSGGGGASQVESARQSIARLREEIAQLNGTASKEGGALTKKLMDIDKMGKAAKMSAAEIRALKDEYATAFKADTLRQFEQEVLRLEGNTAALRELEINKTLTEWGLRFADLGMSAQEAAPHLERLKSALQMQESYKDLQTVADFYKELASLSGEYGESIAYQNQLIDQQRELWLQAGIPLADVDRRVALMRDELSRDMFAGAVRGARKFGAEYGDMAAQVEGFTSQMGQTISNTLADAFMKGKFSAYDFFNSLISYAAQAASNAFIGQIFGGLGNVFGGLFSGGGYVGMAESAVNAIPGFAGVFHSGGVVGTVPADGFRALPASAFAGAPRFHSGGGLGLGANEYPAVLLRGERVLNPEETRAYNAGQRSVVTGLPNLNALFSSFPSSQVMADYARLSGELLRDAADSRRTGAAAMPEITVNVINQTSQNVEAQTEKRQDSNGNMNLDIIITQVDSALAARIRNGKSAIGQTMQKTYGLDKATTIMRGRGR